ncbi:MAG: hypothetical protein IJS03_09155 [Eubacterium sp.]|nr:hypothetical protein [Eubacterium sp.]
MSFKKFLKPYAKKFRGWCKKKEFHSPLFVWFIANSYRFALFLFGKGKKRFDSSYVIMQDYLSEEELASKRTVRRIYNDILFCRFIYGTVTREYFSFDFRFLSHEARKTYVTRNNKYPFYRKFNNGNYVGYLNKKTETYAKFKEFYKREVLCIYGEEDFDAFVEFTKRHERFIYKPADDYGGHGVEIYDSSKYPDKRDLFDIILFNGFCVVEELIVQADPIKALHPSSVNTMRVVAFLSPSGETKIQWCFLRMGMGGSHTDNMSSGGLAIIVDPKTGIAYLPGRDWLGAEHLFHPDTGEKLIGFQIPDWDELLELVNKLSHVIPQIRLVGWDLAYTDKGWIFVEGNATPQCVSAQLTNFNGKLHVYRNMNAEFNAYRDYEAGVIDKEEFDRQMALVNADHTTGDIEEEKSDDE